jgi:hypothetical protein
MPRGPKGEKRPADVIGKRGPYHADRDEVPPLVPAERPVRGARAPIAHKHRRRNAGGV